MPGLADSDVRDDRAALVPGVSPMVYSVKDFDRIAAMMRRESGVVLGERKQMLAYSRIAPLVRAANAATFAAYLDQVEQDPAERTKAISALTTNHTYFNREPHHFEHFVHKVRADLLARAAQGDPVRIWSAGCSSGEEVWTLAMFLLGEEPGEGRTISGRDIVMLASDIATHALNTAERAVYPTEALAAMPEPLRRNWCKPSAEPGTLALGQEARALVRFRPLNLFGSWPFRRLFDVIFCRNVMIYFDNEAKEQLVLGFARQLHVGGHLYIGHSERIAGEANTLLDQVGPTIYRRRNV